MSDHIEKVKELIISSWTLTDLMVKKMSECVCAHRFLAQSMEGLGIELSIHQEDILKAASVVCFTRDPGEEERVTLYSGLLSRRPSPPSDNTCLRCGKLGNWAKGSHPL